MPNITLYTAEGCGECRRVKRILQKHEVSYREASTDELIDLLRKRKSKLKVAKLPAAKLGPGDDAYILFGEDVRYSLHIIKIVADGAVEVRPQ